MQSSGAKPIQEFDTTRVDKLIWFRPTVIDSIQICSKSIQFKTIVKCTSNTNFDQAGKTDGYTWYSKHTKSVNAQGAELYLQVEKHIVKNGTQYWIYLVLDLDNATSAIDVNWSLNVSWYSQAEKKLPFASRDPVQRHGIRNFQHSFSKKNACGPGFQLIQNPVAESELEMTVNISSWKVHIHPVFTITVRNGYAYHINDYYDQKYTTQGQQNGRPCFEFSDATRKGTIKWNLFTETGCGQMAWTVMGISIIRFVSFSDVKYPTQAINWKYVSNDNELFDAPNFFVLKVCAIKNH